MRFVPRVRAARAAVAFLLGGVALPVCAAAEASDYPFPPPTPDPFPDWIERTPPSGMAPLTVNFVNTSPSGPYDMWEWDFGDGSKGGGLEVTHAYMEPGVYHVMVTGIISRVWAASVVHVLTPREAGDLSGDHCVGFEDYALLLEHWGMEQDGTTAGFTDFLAMLEYWGTGAGCAPAPPEPTPEPTPEPAPEPTPESGEKGPWNPSPTLEFSGTPVTGIAPLAVEFSGHANFTDIFLWHFGDGGAWEYGPLSAEHVYTEPGTYTVMLSCFSGIAPTRIRGDYIRVLGHREAGDLDGDRVVDVRDLLVLLNHWGTEVDGAPVGQPDFVAMVEHWGLGA